MPENSLKFINSINMLVMAKSGSMKAIHDAFGGDWEQAWNSDLHKYLPRDSKQQKSQINPEKEWERLLSEKVELITILDDKYPEQLRHIPDPPFLLYVRGSKDAWNNNCFAVVGTRTLSEYGKRAVSSLSLDIARAGFTIVSGLAAGIDTLAHKSALELDMPTIAVLGTGIDDKTIFPAQNMMLAHKIIENGGAVIGEYPMGAHGTKFTFPQRNRIVSGLSKGVLVVEADAQSGAMITARCAAEQGRDVFAVPGNIFAKTSQGTNNIIKKGAKLVTCSEDILEEYEIYLKKVENKIKADNELEGKILAVLSRELTSIDDIIRHTGLDAAKTNATLIMMEIKKKVKNLGGKFILNT